MILAGLPRILNGNISNIHFLCASNKVDCMKMARPLVDDLLRLENEGFLAYDAFIGKSFISQFCHMLPLRSQRHVTKKRPPIPPELIAIE